MASSSTGATSWWWPPFGAQSWPSNITRTQMIVGGVAIGSSLATAATILGSQRLSRARKRQDLRDRVHLAVDGNETSCGRQSEKGRGKARRAPSVGSTDAGTPRYLAGVPGSAVSGLREWDESLIREQLSRNYSFLGDEGMDAIRNAFVIVVGAGGVGSWAALMLLRSGVGRIRLIDFDQVSLSSLNRHACATLADVGRPKVVCCAEKFAQIAPWAKVEAWVELFRGDEAARLLGGRPTYVIDAIDNIDTKVDLLKYCADHRIKCFSSMGAGAKADPSRVQISDITTTTEDPLARAVRRRLRALGIPPIPPKEKQAAPAPEKAKRRKSSKQANGLTEAGKRKPSGIAQATSAATALPNATPAEEIRPLNPPNTKRFENRRASSASSFASGLYTTPPSTPGDGEESVPPVSLENVAEAVAEAGGVEEEAVAEAETGENALDTTLDTLEELQPEDEDSAARDRPPSPEPGTGGNAAPDSDETSAAASYMIPCVYSTEKSDTRLLPLSEEEFARGDVDELAALEDFRVRILPVLGPLPAMFGLAAATYIICDLGGHKMEPLAFKGRRKLYEKVFNDLEVSERRHSARAGREFKRLPFSVEDVAYAFEEIHHGRTVVPPHESLSKAQLQRWDSTLPLSYSNVALFSRDQAKIHEKEVLEGGKSPAEVWGAQALKMMRLRQAEERRMAYLR